MQPVIGVTPLMDTKLDSYWMLPDYMQAVQQAGGLPADAPLPARCRIAGTADRALRRIHLYRRRGHRPHPIPRRAPAGVRPEHCRPGRAGDPAAAHSTGCQQAGAVHLPGAAAAQCGDGPAPCGRTCPAQRPSDISHSQGKPYGCRPHVVELVPGSPLHALLGKDFISVNTRHHQGIRELAPSLAVMATAPDGLIESICLPGSRFAWGVQWHPEHMAPEDPASVQIFEAFVSACIN